MRVLFVHNFYQQFGGEDAVVLAERQMLSDHGETCALYSRHGDELNSYSPAQKLMFPAEAVHSARTVREMSAAIRDFRPDVAYLHNVYPLISPSAYAALAAHDIPIVQVMHNFRPFCLNSYFYTNGAPCELCRGGNYLHGVVRRCFRRSYALSAIYAASHWLMRARGMLDKVSGFICLTPFTRQKLLDAGIPDARIFIRPNAVNVRAIRPVSKPGEHALYLGRLSPEKGLATLLAAFRETPGVPLVIAGSGPMEAELKQYAARYGMRNVRFAGFASGAAKLDLIERARFLVLSSEWYENLPVSILEAYAAGKPVIASGHGSLPYLVRDGETGLLFPPGDAAALARSVRALEDSPRLRERLGENARRLAEKSYDTAASYERLMSIFRAVTGEAAQRQVS